MGVFGGNKSTTAVTNDNSTAVAGSGMGSRVSGDGSPMLDDSYYDNSSRDYTVAEGGVLEVLDGGAVKNSLDFANRSFADVIGWAEQVEQSSKDQRDDILLYSDATIKKTGDSISNAFKAAEGKAVPLDGNIAMFGAVAVALGFVFLRKVF